MCGYFKSIYINVQNISISAYLYFNHIQVFAQYTINRSIDEIKLTDNYHNYQSIIAFQDLQIFE